MIASGTTACCAVGRVCGDVTELPPGVRGAGADTRSSEFRSPSTHTALVAKAPGALAERAEISQGGVAFDACVVSVRDGPIQGDEVQRQAHRPVNSGLRSGWHLTIKWYVKLQPRIKPQGNGLVKEAEGNGSWKRTEEEKSRCERVREGRCVR